MIGLGSVSQCALPLIIDLFLSKEKMTSLTIIDVLDTRTLYHRYMQLIDLKNDPTANIDHGCNPGLVSHFTNAHKSL